MKRLFLIILTLLSIFILLSSVLGNSIASLFFLPIPVYFLVNLITNSDEFSLAKHKRAIFYYFGIIVILSLVSISKFV